MGLIMTILAGAFIGWIASIIMKSNAQMGAIANIICGILGAFVGGVIANVLNVGGEGVGSAGFSFSQLLFGILGACIVIAIYRAITGSRPLTH